jgi:Icc-related predicted phosphoesterase
LGEGHEKAAVIFESFLCLLASLGYFMNRHQALACFSIVCVTLTLGLSVRGEETAVDPRQTGLQPLATMSLQDRPQDDTIDDDGGGVHPDECDLPRLRHDPAFSSVDQDHIVVAFMGDPQLHMNPKSLDHAKTAMNDLAQLPHDFLVVLGDLVQNKSAYFADYKRLVLEPSTKPVYSIAGNAELGAGLDSYRKCTGLPLNYVIVRRGIRFIFLSVKSVTGPMTHICNLGDEQLAWLRAELASDNKSTTIIAFHAPVFETTWHSEDRESRPFPGSMYLKESAEMRSLFAMYSNIKVYIHGHLHHAYGVRDEYGRNEYCLNDGVLHISVGATANNHGSSVLFIGSDEIVARVRDHATRQWREKFDFTLETKTTFEPATKIQSDQMTDCRPALPQTSH